MECPYYEVRVGLGKEGRCQKGVATRVNAALDVQYRKFVKKKKLAKLPDGQERGEGGRLRRWVWDSFADVLRRWSRVCGRMRR
jgi:hypothetical protein